MPNCDLGMRLPKVCTTSTLSCQDQSETDNVTAVELQRQRRVLYFSDGTMEEPSDSDTEAENDTTDRAMQLALDESEMPLGPRLKYKAYKMGHSLLAGIDYVGGGLASILGITTPRYASEMEYFKRSVAGETDQNANGTWLRNGASSGDNRRGTYVITEDPKPSENSHIMECEGH